MVRVLQIPDLGMGDWLDNWLENPNHSLFLLVDPGLHRATVQLVVAAHVSSTRLLSVKIYSRKF